jgi:hypothetical protein
MLSIATSERERERRKKKAIFILTARLLMDARVSWWSSPWRLVFASSARRYLGDLKKKKKKSDLYV